jgi:hypothetical protein
MALADEVIEQFAALQESAFGTKRTGFRQWSPAFAALTQVFPT